MLEPSDLSFPPVPAIGAEVLPGKIILKGGAERHRRRDRQGAPLTVILRGERMPGTKDGSGRSVQVRAIGAA